MPVPRRYQVIGVGPVTRIDAPDDESHCMGMGGTQPLDHVDKVAVALQTGQAAG